MAAADQPFSDLTPDERRLDGALSHGEQGEPDATERRIRWLVAQRLVPLASAAGGWDWLFRDPRDGRLWEQRYPLGSLHGPGPRCLVEIEASAARAKYGFG